jgi:hypothetical protein
MFIHVNPPRQAIVIKPFPRAPHDCFAPIPITFPLLVARSCFRTRSAHVHPSAHARLRARPLPPLFPLPSTTHPLLGWIVKYANAHANAHVKLQKEGTVFRKRAHTFFSKLNSCCSAGRCHHGNRIPHHHRHFTHCPRRHFPSLSSCTAR